MTIAFAVLSYAGTVAVTIVADAQHWPDLSLVGQGLQRELDELTRHAVPARRERAGVADSRDGQ